MAREDDAPAGYVSTRKAAEMLGLHRESLLRAIRQGRYPLEPYSSTGYRTHRKYWFRREAVLAFRERRQALQA